MATATLSLWSFFRGVIDESTALPPCFELLLTVTGHVEGPHGVTGYSPADQAMTMRGPCRGVRLGFSGVP